jgi:hypothetical protein
MVAVNRLVGGVAEPGPYDGQAHAVCICLFSIHYAIMRRYVDALWFCHLFILSFLIICH